MVSQDLTPQPKKSLNITLDYRFVVVLLVLIIVGMLFMWRPWEFRPAADARTVTISGEAKLSAVPDEFVFMPSYEFKDGDKDAILEELGSKSDEVVKKLKELGVADNKIKTDTEGYDSTPWGYNGTTEEELNNFVPPTNTGPNYTLRMTITVGSKALAQKVQDYLVTTAPLGAISPQVGFSDEKTKELESKAREMATKEARAKAEQSAKNLGFSVGEVKAVSDGVGFGGVYPYAAEGRATDVASSSPKLEVQPGENDLTYQVTVVYYIK